MLSHTHFIQVVQKKAGIDLTTIPSIVDIFNSTSQLKPVARTHVGLISTENLFSNHPQIEGIWLQAISPKMATGTGRIRQHDHLDVTEIIIVKPGGLYAGLPESIANLSGYAIYVVNAGTPHGSDVEASYGQWVSIKIKA